MNRFTLCFLLALALALCLPAEEIPYQKPPAAIQAVLDAPLIPTGVLSPAGTHLLLQRAVPYPPIADLARPMLRLAGLRVNPQNNMPHSVPRIGELAIRRVSDGRETRIALPPGSSVYGVRWSPDGKRFAFLNAAATAGELWVGDASTGAIRKVPALAVNGASGEAFIWMPGSGKLLVKAVPSGRGKAPAPPAAPKGPVIQEGKGASGPVRTYQDLLQNPYDEQLFDYYLPAQLTMVDAASLTAAALGKPQVFLDALPAPDGKHFLVRWVHRPYSYLHTITAFPREVEVWDAQGRMIHKVASLPLEDKIPIEGVALGPRQVSWHPTLPAALTWVEALDGGDPKKKADHRDQVMMLAAPFPSQPRVLHRTQHRFAGMDWLENGTETLISDYDRDRRWVRTVLVQTSEPGGEPKQIFSRSIRDRYKNPGSPVEKTLPSGHRAVHQRGDWIYLAGAGATPEGDRPFLDRMNVRTLATERLFRSAAAAYETFAGMIHPEEPAFLTRKESPTDPPNYFVRTSPQAVPKALTTFADPMPQIRGIRKQLVKYKRADGVDLSFTLYLPPDYQPGSRLPTLIWAYPLEFNDPDTAGQVTGSTQRFVTMGGISHLFFVLAGYAVLDDASMPVVGDPETMNNTYVEQIVSSAQAAIDKAVELGVTDPARVGVGGHSYGAFMTANLLAHCDLFRAGIARSGAYNRTLTPFGFQSERRTLWEAPDTYAKVSPFMHAHKIKEPLLLLHGAADNNPGTFPIQSERMYQAVRGNGGTVRLVMLPFESHGYIARESVEHTLFEMIAWFDRYVKAAGSAEIRRPAAWNTGALSPRPAAVARSSRVAGVPVQRR